MQLGSGCLRLPIRAREKKAQQWISLRAHEEGLGISKSYPTAIAEIPEIKNQFVGMRFPSAEHVADTLLTVPVHPLLTEADRRRIATFLKDIELSEICLDHLLA